MNSQKGITLVSLTIYIIAMVIVVGIVAVISSYFYQNVNTSTDQINPLAEYTKLNSFFTEEVNHDQIKVLECKTTYQETNEIESSYIVFDDGVQYTYLAENEAVYRNQAKICQEVKSCMFENRIKNGKDIVVLTITIGNGTEKTVEYTLKN